MTDCYSLALTHGKSTLAGYSISAPISYLQYFPHGFREKLFLTLANITLLCETGINILAIIYFLTLLKVLLWGKRMRKGRRQSGPSLLLVLNSLAFWSHHMLRVKVQCSFLSRWNTCHFAFKKNNG